MLHEISHRIIRGEACKNSLHIVRLTQGWARKPPPTKRCNKETAVKRAGWIQAFYAQAVQRGIRANEYTAEMQVRLDHPDEDEMWMDSCVLKSHFGKLTKARKSAKEASSVQEGGAA